MANMMRKLSKDEKELETRMNTFSNRSSFSVDDHLNLLLICGDSIDFSEFSKQFNDDNFDQLAKSFTGLSTNSEEASELSVSSSSSQSQQTKEKTETTLKRHKSAPASTKRVHFNETVRVVTMYRAVNQSNNS
mmetsp:Transcript_18096/g.18155  ORF Transcript_18096/g.18155 Transcript_18096/m.18155 type:complete len:133 (-) Transcript_18096:70-468(-)